MNSEHAIGLDVSSFQPAINWAQVRGSGRSFMFAKASEGMTVPAPEYPAQFAGAGAAGLLRGAYSFWRTTSDPIAQVRRFVDLIRAQGEPELGYVLDVEYQKTGAPLGSLDAATFGASVIKSLRELQSLTDRQPGIYVGPAFFAMLQPSARKEIASLAWLWQAQFRDTPPPPIPEWAAWRFWQRSDKEDVPGVGPVDGNVFAGTEAELLAMVPASFTGDAEAGGRLWKLAQDVDAGREGLT